MSAMLQWAQRADVHRAHYQKKSISREQYEHWASHDLLFDLLRGDHPGQSFCQRFDIQDNIISSAYYSHNYHTQFINYIERYYVQQ